jgi:ABC-type Na+ efflux pump permease subunit
MLGFAQFAVTGLAALVAALAVGSARIPAVSGGVLAWVVAWFILGYAIYAMACGALGSLASRTDDAPSVAGPVQLPTIAAILLITEAAHRQQVRLGWRASGGSPSCRCRTAARGTGSVGAATMAGSASAAAVSVLPDGGAP